MTIPSGYLPREGDVLVLLATVKFDVEPGDTGIHVKINGHYERLMLKPSDFVGLRRRTWRAGEVARSRNDPTIFGEVICISGDGVWLKLDPQANRKGATHGHRTVHCNELEPMPEPELKEAENPEPALAFPESAPVTGEEPDAQH